MHTEGYTVTHLPSPPGPGQGTRLRAPPRPSRRAPRRRARQEGHPRVRRPANGGRPLPRPAPPPGAAHWPRSSPERRGPHPLPPPPPPLRGGPAPPAELRFSWARTVQQRQWEPRRAPRRAGWRRRRRCGEAGGQRQARGFAGRQGAGGEAAGRPPLRASGERRVEAR